MTAPDVLYDAPGPRSRRRILWGTAAALTALAALLALAIARLSRQGQLDEAKWGPLINPSDPQFGLVWEFLGGGLVATLQAAAISIVLSLALGSALAVARVSATRAYRWAVVGFIELFRGVPVVMSVFFAARVLPEIGIDLPTMWFLVIGLTLYNSVVIAEVIRAGIQALPKGQAEAAYAIGLTQGATLRLILLPQAFRITLPALIGQLVVVLKDTSLGFIISYEELLRRGQIAVQTLENPLQMFCVIGTLFILVNFSLSQLAEAVERRMSRPPRRTDPPAQLDANSPAGALPAAANR
ncbi:amino acid ABC transporter permease [Streptomyces sp. NPDC006602]|uniref:amino acid ABC transporter permease n=1 Tax=Streptomyces sp. NPDC006602 TaxID=3364751 RepID=UPI0036821CEA